MKLPVGSVVTKRCHCGGVHRDPDHPTYEVETFTPNRWMPQPGDEGTYRLRNLQTGRTHTTRTVSSYVILTMPTEAVLVEP